MEENKGGKPYAWRRAHFIERAKALWGDVYDYSDLQFTTGKEPCIIRCRKHGLFPVAAAQNHIMKDPRFRTGCPWCSEEQTGRPDKRLHKEHRAKKKAEREAKRAERAAMLEQNRKDEEQHKIERRQCVADHGYDLSSLTDREIIQRYASIKGQEALAPINEQKRIERERKKAEEKELRIEREEERIRKRTADLIEKAKAVHGDKYDYSLTYYERRQHVNGNKYGYLCNIFCKEHGAFDTRADVHIQQRCECPKCKNHLNEVPAEVRGADFIRRAKERFPGKFSYRDVVYLNNDTPVKIFCKEHRLTFECTPDTHIRGAGGCPLCTKSIGEAMIYKWLTDNNIPFDSQKKIPNENQELELQYLVVDFYLPEHNLFIEMNGEQHYKDVEHFKRNKKWTLESQQMRDETVRKYCKINGIHLLEIKYDQIDRIPKILKRAIKKYTITQ